MENLNLTPAKLQDIIFKVSQNKRLTVEEGNIVIRCLGYQIPKKPRKAGNHYFCLKCNKTLPLIGKYCSCGYKIDWDGISVPLSSDLSDADIADKILSFCWDYDSHAYADNYGNYNDLSDRTDAIANVMQLLLNIRQRIIFAKEIVSVLANEEFSDLWNDRDTVVDAVIVVDALLAPVMEELNSPSSEDNIFYFLWSKIRTIFLYLYIENDYCFSKSERGLVIYPDLYKDKLTFLLESSDTTLSNKRVSYNELLKILV